MKNSPIPVLQPERFMGVILPYLRGLLGNDTRVAFQGSHLFVSQIICVILYYSKWGGGGERMGVVNSKVFAGDMN